MGYTDVTDGPIVARRTRLESTVILDEFLIMNKSSKKTSKINPITFN